MSDNRTNAEKRAADLRFSMMSSERPLDALIAGLSTAEPALPQSALHPRILELGPDEGDAWVLAMWADPGSLQDTHEQIRRLLEATLLANITRTAETGEALDRVPSKLRLFVFTTTQENLVSAIRLFGFTLDENIDMDDQALQTLRQEGLDAGWQVPELPVSSWTATIRQPSTHGPARLASLHTELRELFNDDCWGSNPGAFSHTASLLFKRQLGEEIRPTLQGLDIFERIVAQRDVRNDIRWIPAALFQALADFVGVVIQQVYDHKVEWALCEPESDGFGPPPVFRITYKNGSSEHLNIGMHLLRWCVMPILDGEELPRLSEWLNSEFRDTLKH